MINIMIKYIQMASVKILNKVRITIMYLLQEDQCCFVTLSSQSKRIEEFISSHEVADHQLLVSIFSNQS